MFLKIHESSLPLIPESPGCYWLIRMTDGKSSLSIGRVSDTDENGILYIGQSKNLRVRFKEMLKQFKARTSEISAIAKAGHTRQVMNGMYLLRAGRHIHWNPFITPLK